MNAIASRTIMSFAVNNFIVDGIPVRDLLTLSGSNF